MNTQKKIESITKEMESLDENFESIKKFYIYNDHNYFTQMWVEDILKDILKKKSKMMLIKSKLELALFFSEHQKLYY